MFALEIATCDLKSPAMHARQLQRVGTRPGRAALVGASAQKVAALPAAVVGLNGMAALNPERGAGRPRRRSAGRASGGSNMRSGASALVMRDDTMMAGTPAVSRDGDQWRPRPGRASLAHQLRRGESGAGWLHIDPETGWQAGARGANPGVALLGPG